MKYVLLFLVITLSLSCADESPSLDEVYLDSLDHWKKERLADLKKPLGYLSQVGLQWIKEGENTMGSTKDNDIQMPSTMPENIGKVNRAGNLITANITHPEVTVNGASILSIDLKPDSEQGYATMQWKSFHWYLIKRGDRYALRVKDTLADMRINMEHIPHYEPSGKWIIEADFVVPEKGETQSFKNHVDITYDNDVKGRLQFDHAGKSYEMVATDGGEGQLFMVFGDDTNGETTYGGGRFLYADLPDSGTKVILDFNKAENPICSFNDFGTCPYPPAQNILDFPIPAGEKKVRN